MDKQTVREKLGLEDPAEWLKKTGSGHITMMLVEAVSLLSEGKVVVVRGHNAGYTDRLVRQVREMCWEVGVKQPKVVGWTITSNYRYRSDTAVVLIDHYAKGRGTYETNL